MKLVTKNKPKVLNETEVIAENGKLLIESFNRCPDAATFLRENANIENADQMFHKLALTESVIEDKTFLFENGMKIPSIGTKMKSMVTLNGIFEAAENESEFVQLVESNIIPVLDISLTEADKTNLVDHYKKFKLL